MGGELGERSRGCSACILGSIPPQQALGATCDAMPTWPQLWCWLQSRLWWLHDASSTSMGT